MSDGITAGERRELRSVVRNQFKVLRAEVKRREQEMEAEVEEQLLEKYRNQDKRVHELAREIGRINAEARRQAEEALDRVLADDPDLAAELGYSYGNGLGVKASSKTRAQLRRTALTRIPAIVGDANLALDRQEADLLRELSVGALDSGEASKFLGTIPTVGQLVPRARLQEIEQAAGDPS